jgi:putative nucleotidyltransferase with HDIG domain
MAILACVGEGGTHVPLSRVVGALSFALDITEGEPPGHAARGCAIGMRIAEEIGLDDAARSDLFYALLLKDAGCSANSARMAALFGADDHVAKRTSKRVDWSGRFPAFLWSVRTVAPGQGVRARIQRLNAIRTEGEVTAALMRARCDRGAEIVRMAGFTPGTAEAIRGLDEHWDGGGQPRGARGEEIPLGARILCLSQTAEIFHRAGGVRAAWAVARRRRGRWFDPALVDALGAIRADHAFWAELADGDVSRWEPADRVLHADDEWLDAISLAFAGVVDAKSPWTYRHSDRACLIALDVAAALGVDGGTLREMRRAALLHDIGKLAVSNRILDKPGQLTADEFDRVRQHPAITEQILRRIPGCEDLATMAAAHHERLDGGGYPRGLTGAELTLPMRVLAIADVYEALTSERPYRRAMSSDEALGIMRVDVPHRLDPDAFGTLSRLLDRTAGDPFPHAAVRAAERSARAVGR